MDEGKAEAEEVGKSDWDKTRQRFKNKIATLMKGHAEALFSNRGRCGFILRLHFSNLPIYLHSL